MFWKRFVQILSAWICVVRWWPILNGRASRDTARSCGVCPYRSYRMEKCTFAMYHVELMKKRKDDFRKHERDKYIWDLPKPRQEQRLGSNEKVFDQARNWGQKKKRENSEIFGTSARTEKKEWMRNPKTYMRSLEHRPSGYMNERS